jgi:hypothetical protein|tara:strand:- start:148 stop:615 length:468 start_codon:yes stop_codon:yes gene_type:complete
MKVIIETWHKPLCLAPTLSSTRVSLAVEPTWKLVKLKRAVQALCRTRAGRTSLDPGRQVLSVKQEDEETGGLKRVVLEDDETTLLGFDVPDGAIISLKVKAFEPKPVEDPPPWYNDFGREMSLTHSASELSLGGTMSRSGSLASLGASPSRTALR